MVLDFLVFLLPVCLLSMSTHRCISFPFGGGALGGKGSTNHTPRNYSDLYWDSMG